MKKHMLLVIVLLAVAVVLSSCTNPPKWEVANEGELCTKAIVIDRDWADTDRSDFFSLV